MNATKRKFNALLQGLGSRSSSDPDRPPVSRPTTSELSHSKSISSSTPSSMAIDAELLAKRRRLGLAAGPTNGTNGASHQASATLAGVVLRKTGQDGAAKKVPEPPKYSPTDRGELLRRLATFQELTDWTPKPERVSEVEWAKRGWVCQGKERVRCTLCHKELVVGLNRKEVDGKEVSVLVPADIEGALVEKYAELIVTAHQEDCLWRKRGCDDSLLRLSLTNAKASLEALRQRYDELCQRKSFLPYEFNLRLPDGLDLDAILTQLPSEFFSNPAPADTGVTSPNRVALALAILGWQGLSNARIGAVPNSASCHTCLRRLGLWMFKSKEVSAEGEVLVPAPMDHLDAVREHRFFCPWKNAAAQKLGSARPNPDGDLPAWKVLVQSIKNDAYLRGALEDRPKSRARPKTRDGQSSSALTAGRGAAATAPATPTAAGLDSPVIIIGPDGVEEEDESVRDAKDKERWARLRKVKSLFDTKSGKKLRRPGSRPGTGHSTMSISGP